MVILVASMPYWYTDRGGDDIDPEIWWGFYSIIFIAAFPLLLGSIVVKWYRLFRYSRAEREKLMGVGFFSALGLGWALILPVAAIWYKQLANLS